MTAKRVGLFAAMLAAAVSVRAQSAAPEPFLNGLNAAERVQFVGEFKRSVLAAAQDVLQDARNPKVRNGAYSLELLRERVQSRIADKEFALTRQRTQQSISALDRKVSEQTDKFLDDLSPEVDRLSRGALSAAELSAQLIRVADHVEGWAGGKAVTGADAQKAGQLQPTADNVLGPFHRLNARFLEAGGVITDSEPGTRLWIRGRVTDIDGRPVVGAIVDVWQTDAKGAYDIADPRDRENPKVPHRFRARFKTDRDGGYSFGTIKPGNYEFAENEWRSMHIHYKITAPGFKDLITPLFFKGDRFSAVDPWWKASTTIELRPHHSGAEFGDFDIVVEKK